MTRFRPLTILVLAALALFPAYAAAQTAQPDTAPATTRDVSRAVPVSAAQGMVVAQEKRAAEIGAKMLERGGNAVDAAVAVGFALAVTLPRAGNLGGGGFMVVHRAGGKPPVTIDYRETAPAATTRDVFLDAQGAADPAKSRDSGLGVGVPGTVAGLALAHRLYGSGKLTLAELMAPAIALARDGIPVEDDLFDSLTLLGRRLARWPSSTKIFFKPDGSAFAAGDTLKQPDLAASLEAIARKGPRAFYRGAVAQKIVTSVNAAGGRMTTADLRSYRPVIRPPVRGTYRGLTVLSMPPSSSGGIHLVEMLNILERFPLASLGAGSPEALHLMIEAMKLAYADRAEYLGDSDTVDVPVGYLTSKPYAETLAASIDPKRARPSREIHPSSKARGEGDNTTHFSVIDRFGNAVANTYTLNFNFGLGLVADGTGILLNNELDDFAAKPGAPNAFGLIGSAANAPGSGKRPLSSMTPSIVLKDGKPILITGAPGGSRIISAVLQVIVNATDFGMPIADAVSAPRVHHQWMPDEVLAEPTLPAATVAALKALGHNVRTGPISGSAHSIAVTADGIVGAADARSRGAAAKGY